MSLVHVSVVRDCLKSQVVADACGLGDESV